MVLILAAFFIDNVYLFGGLVKEPLISVFSDSVNKMKYKGAKGASPM